MATQQKTARRSSYTTETAAPAIPGTSGPHLDSLPVLSAHPGMTVAFTATAFDPNGESLSYSLINNPPSGAAIDSASGDFTWTPAWSQLGAQTITVRVTNSSGLSATGTCSVTVANSPPVLDPLPDFAAHPGQPVAFSANAFDPDGDALTFTLLSPPSGATMTAAGVFNWTPTWSQLGARTITVKVTDPGGLSDVKTCTITVGNQPPTLNPLSDLQAHPTRNVTFSASASDLDGDALTFSLIGAPSGASINSTSGVFSWTPTWSQLGAHTITVKVTDPGGLSDSKTCVITVANQPPVLDPLADRSVNAGMSVSFTATASDPDADPLTYSLINNPPTGASIGSTNGVFSWTPTAAGAYTVTVRVADPGGLSDVKSCTITVNP